MSTGVFLIGFYLIASRLRRFSDKMSFMGKAMMAAIYVLVFVMGLNMGINEQVTSSLGIIGLQALVITVLFGIRKHAVYILRKEKDENG